MFMFFFFFFFSSRRRHTRFDCDWSSDVCSSDLVAGGEIVVRVVVEVRRNAPDPRIALGLGLKEHTNFGPPVAAARQKSDFGRSEERRVGKECRSRWSPYQ